MKTRLALLLLTTLPFSGRAQPGNPKPILEILLIGTAHDYGKPPVEAFDYPINKALAFRPDAVFGEDLSPGDYDALTDFWNKKALDKRVAYVRSHPYPDPENPDLFIQQTYALLRDQPNRYRDRINLARALLLTHDFGNARYQLYQLDQAKNEFSPADHEAYRNILGEPDSLYRSRSGEYHTIFFPLLTKRKQDRILPMDCQQYDGPWQLAWDSLNTKLDRVIAAITDTNAADYRLWNAYLRWQNTFRTASEQAQQAGRLTQYMNSDTYNTQVDSVNFGGDLWLRTMTGYPVAEAVQMRHNWQLRNEAMCQNLVGRARAAGAHRVVVGVGSAHRKTMIDILRTTPQVVVYTLNEYQPEPPLHKP